MTVLMLGGAGKVKGRVCVIYMFMHTPEQMLTASSALTQSHAECMPLDCHRLCSVD